MKTPNDVHKLKEQWLIDPCWDIEETEGYEEYRDELKTWREQFEERMREAHRKHMLRNAQQFGVTLEAIAYLEKLERKIVSLERLVADLIYFNNLDRK
jgi:cyclopropane fatty-acyl-phospholipid synthase-like methyltransferase